MHHTLVIAIDTEGIVHELEEMGAGDDVILQDDDGVMLLKDLRDALDDITFEIVVLGALHNRHF